VLNASERICRYTQQFLLHAEVVCTLYRDTLGMKRYADRRTLHGTITQQIDQKVKFDLLQIRMLSRAKRDAQQNNLSAVDVVNLGMK
jgi:predicted HTH transcriptional regulator